MTAPYSVAFAAESPDLIDGCPPSQLTYAELKSKGGTEYELIRDTIKRLIAAPPFSEVSEDPELVGGPGSRWARRHLYRLDPGNSSSAATAFTIWINTPGRRWWLTWARDPQDQKRILIYSLTPAPGE